MATNLEIFNDLLGCLKYLIETTVTNLESNKPKVYSKTCSLKRLNNATKRASQPSRSYLHSSSPIASSLLKSTEIKHHLVSTKNSLKINFELKALAVSNHESQMSSSTINSSHRQLATIFKINFADLVNFYFKVQEYYLKLQLNQVDVHSCVSSQLGGSQQIGNQQHSNYTQAKFDCLSIDLINPTQLCIESKAKADASTQVDLPLFPLIKQEKKKKIKIKPRLKYGFIEFIPIVDTSINHVVMLNESTQIAPSNIESTQLATQSSSAKCKRTPIRIGLSKRQKIKASLHSKFLNIEKKL